jgi:hypothetical protein
LFAALNEAKQCALFVCELAEQIGIAPAKAILRDVMENEDIG